MTRQDNREDEQKTTTKRKIKIKIRRMFEMITTKSYSNK